MFIEYTQEEQVNINTEDATVYYRNVNGVSCMFVDRNNEKFAVWTNSDRYFVVWTDASCDEIQEIVKNVKFIE